MNADERRVLSILVNTNQTLYAAKKSNNHRINSFEEIPKNRYNSLYNVSVATMEEPLDILRDEIYNMLNFTVEYIDVLSQIEAVNIYDAAEIIVEIGDIKRFQNKKHFLSYCGLSPVMKKNGKYYKITKNRDYNIVANRKQDSIDYCENLKKVLMRCSQKLIIMDPEYKEYYQNYKRQYQLKHMNYSLKRLHLMALKKVTIKFANLIYKEFKDIAIIEELDEND